ncbi:Nan (predicted) [Pycnogonum litorale]
MRFRDLLKRRIFWADGKKPSNVIEWSPEDRTLLLRNVTSGLKRQTVTDSRPLYSLLNFTGGGELVEIMQEASRNRDFSKVDGMLEEKVKPFLYNDGEGKLIEITELILKRNQSRPEDKRINLNTQNEACGYGAGIQISSWDISDYDQSVMYENGNVLYNKRDAGKYREVCFDINKVGNFGEGILHLCLLKSSKTYGEIAKRLLRIFPKLINDICISDEYYGENLLHMAVVNEDPAMVKYLLDRCVNFHERCYGNFMCPEDQKASRRDSLEHEWVDVNLKTNYIGYVYWGEYPLSFAACLGQEECYRLMLAKGADPNNQDTNGNTTVHMMVIYEKIKMFDMIYELGASTVIKNYQGFTPLTLSARLARKEIFAHMLDLQREIYWQLGNITSTAYPLSEVDTICAETGNINRNSALNLVVFGDQSNHLDMLEGLLIELLNAKWNKYVKLCFFRQFFFFTVYFVISLSCFVMRPNPLKNSNSTKDTDTTFNNTNHSSSESGIRTASECYLLNTRETRDLIRICLECLVTFGSLLYVLNATREAWYLGRHIFSENLSTAPSRVSFLISCVLVLFFMIPARVACSSKFEDIVAVLVMLTTGIHFLFFARGFKIVGPFVIMIYNMIVTDLLCFVLIYVVFILGFSQAYYVLFLSHNGHGVNYFRNLGESIMALFVMSLLKFDNIYSEFDNTAYPVVCKILFFMFMSMVSVLLINMLIAMMGKTYQTIASRRNEWLRQWARIVLVVERGVSPFERKKQHRVYSQPLRDGGRAFILRLNTKDVCLLLMKAKAEVTTAPCDFVLGTCIISCVVVTLMTIGYYIFKLMKGDDDYRLNLMLFLGVHTLMTFLHFVVGIVVAVGYSNFRSVLVPAGAAATYQSYFVTLIVASWITFILWSILAFISFLKLRS